jgi:hypothetical protein
MDHTIFKLTPKRPISDQAMKAFGIYILTDRTLRILLDFARNTALNEFAYREMLDKGIRSEQPLSPSPDSVYLLPSSSPSDAPSPHS